MKHQNITKKVIAHIMTRTTKELAVLTRNEIAEVFNINISYLSLRFKLDTKKTILDYIDFEKMIRAKVLLQHRFDLTIEEISESLGIRKTNQFRSKFKKHYYITPGDFRKSHKMRQNGTTFTTTPTV